LLDILGLPAPVKWDGSSLLAPNRPPRSYFFAAAWGQHLLGVRDENWKYIYDIRNGQEELYDLATDPDEQRSQANDHQDVAQRSRQRLAAWLQAIRNRDHPERTVSASSQNSATLP